MKTKILLTLLTLWFVALSPSLTSADPVSAIIDGQTYSCTPDGANCYDACQKSYTASYCLDRCGQTDGCYSACGKAYTNSYCVDKCGKITGCFETCTKAYTSSYCLDKCY